MCFFFFNDTATTEIYTLSLHDALPISSELRRPEPPLARARRRPPRDHSHALRQHRRHPPAGRRSEEHTSELQSPCNLVCRLLLEKKKSIEHTDFTTQHHAARCMRPLHD